MLQVEYRKTVDLELLHNNPRTIKEEDFKQLCESVEKNKLFFEARPIILSDRTGMLVVIAGNQRLRAAIEIGMNEVPTVLIPGLTEEQETEIVFRDNISNGEFDWDIIANEFSDFPLADWGVDVSFVDYSETNENDYSNSEGTIDFVDKDTNDSGVEDTEDKLLKQYKEKTCAVIERLDNIGLPYAGEQIRLITKRSFNAIAFLLWVQEKANMPIDEALFCIYSINHEASVIINDLILEGKIKTATILMSNLRNKAHREKERQTKQYFIDNPSVELIFASSHSKIMSFKIGNDYYTVEGSGNLSYNSRIEQFVIDNDKDVFEFTKGWIQEIKTFLSGKKEFEIYPKLKKQNGEGTKEQP